MKNDSAAYTPDGIIRTYLLLMLVNTLATSLIWGINTLFLLDAGLNNTEAFAANAFFTVGQVLFEVPTGVIADFQGRRMSFLLGSLTLMISTLLYLWMWQVAGPFWGWAVASVFLGLGFTFFSGATEAWLVDALEATNFRGELDSVFAKGQVVTGAAMLGGSVLGGVIAQYTNLGVPYVLRAVALLVAFGVAYFLMEDLGFAPEKGKSPLLKVREILSSSVQFGFRRASVRWMMFSQPFVMGVTVYAFYAMQPHLLKLWGDPKAFSVAGAVAAILAAAQMMGGFTAPWIRPLFRRRTTLIFTSQALGSILLIVFATVHSFWMAIVLIVLWALISAAITPVRQTFINGLIPSKQRATVLSLDSLMGAVGGVVFQPGLGKAADLWGYPISYLLCGVINAGSLPFFLLARAQNEDADSVRLLKDSV